MSQWQNVRAFRVNDDSGKIADQINACVAHNKAPHESIEVVPLGTWSSQDGGTGGIDALVLIGVPADAGIANTVMEKLSL